MGDHYMHVHVCGDIFPRDEASIEFRKYNPSSTGQWIMRVSTNPTNENISYSSTDSLELSKVAYDILLRFQEDESVYAHWRDDRILFAYYQRVEKMAQQNSNDCFLEQRVKYHTSKQTNIALHSTNANQSKPKYTIFVPKFRTEETLRVILSLFS